MLTAGDFQWVSRWPVVPIVFNNWAMGQPNNANQNGHCVEIRRADNFQWSNGNCWYEQRFVCEMNDQPQ